MSKESSYRQIFKTTSIFGGVQVFNIIINIIRSKLIAILLGPAGMGIVGLLNSTTTIVGNITNCGLSTSSVKNVAAANASGDMEKVSKVIGVLRRLVWITGVTGAIIMFFAARWLSELTFNNRDYTYAFMALSITLLFTQVNAGQMVVLQGLRKIKYLALADLIGTIIGLVVSVPIYFVWRTAGIVPAIIITSVCMVALSWYFSSKIKLEKYKVTVELLRTEGREMITMGFFLSFSGLITLAASYVVRIFINREGGIEQVGLYNSGFAIITSYVGLVFTAMATDYYPRLSAVAYSNRELKRVINQQAEIAVLIISPIISIFLVYINFVVIILYSSKFSGVDGMIHWAALGMIFKAASWSIGFILLAKGESKVFFWNELLNNIYTLVLNLVGYHYGGLSGLGISFLVGYFIYFFQVFFLAKIRYEFSFEKDFFVIMLVQLLINVSCFLLVLFLHRPYNYLGGTIFILLSFLYTFRELDKRLALKSFLMKFKQRMLK
ncbi:MAG TPA: O-antigen translocase [Mucilaginibacter sp.]|nr:O-antigen translocase [Mucilaginibacter sp.]